MDKKMILTISVLTSRKEEQVRRCLESLRPLREAVSSELIIVDTSEDAHMHAVVSEYADAVVSFHWTEDFAAARNAGLERARGQWFLYLDDDEWFADVRELIAFFQSDVSREMDGATYIQRNYMNRQGTSYRDDGVSRVARLIPGRRFVGRVHEYFEPELGKVFVTDSYVEHYGYVFDSYEEKKKHFLRNTHILQKLTEEEPDNQRWWVHLAQEYISMRDYENMRKIADEGFKMLGDAMDAESVRSRGTFYMSRILSYVDKAESKSLIREGQTALEDPRLSRLCKACIRWWMAHGCFRLGEYRQCIRLLKEYLKDYEYYMAHPTELESDRMSIAVSSCYEKERMEECYELLICAGLKENREKYLTEYVEKLDFSTQGAFYEDDFFILIRNAVPDFSQSRNFAGLILKISTKPDAWRRFCESCESWIESGDQRLKAVVSLCDQLSCAQSMECFIRYKEAAKSLSAGCKNETYAEIKAVLTKFMTGIFGHCKAIYGSDFREKDTLPPDALVGLIIEQMFEMENDEETFAAGIGQIPLVCPQYGDAIERFLGLYRAEGEKKSQKAQEELFELRVQVLDQARILIMEGQKEAAAAILDQLMGIFPEDDEIRTLKDDLTVDDRSSADKK